MKVVLALTLLIGLGCNKQSAAPSCGDRVKAFDEALAAPGADACSTDADCKCFRGGISEKHSCGGVTGSKTNEKVSSIAAGWDDAQCRSGINCAAWVCSPACQAGKCTNGPPPKVTPAPEPTTSASSKVEGGTSMTCDARVAEIDRVLASGTTKCASDKDCACFRGGVSKKDPCGGITDAKTNARFETMAKEWSAAECKNDGVMCPAMVCEPHCNAGTCGPGQIIP